MSWFLFSLTWIFGNPNVIVSFKRKDTIFYVFLSAVTVSPKCPQNVPKIIRHFKNLATNVARFVKCVWPFGDISHWRVKSYNFIIFKSEIDDFMKANYLCCIEIIFKKLISYPKDRNWRFERRISGYNLNSDNYEKIKVSCQTFTI